MGLYHPDLPLRPTHAEIADFYGLLLPEPDDRRKCWCCDEPRDVLVATPDGPMCPHCLEEERLAAQLAAKRAA